MQVTYTISTVDSPEYKRLICGRTDDIARLIDYISQGRSIALFGERRIGKSSLLYLVRDIINNQIDNYREDFIDLSLKNAVQSLSSRVSNYKAIYLDLQALNKSDSEAFMQLVNNKFKDNGLFHDSLGSSTTSINFTIPELFSTVNNQLINGERLVILVDEVEVLLELAESKQIFRNIRSVIQSCARICFVIAGADYWHKEIKDKTSPIVNNVQTFYLKAAARFPIENYLIKQPLDNYIYGIDINTITRTILEWTECKPWYVQAVCQAVVEINAECGQLQKGWQAVVMKRVEDSVESTLDRFYFHDNPDNISQKILVLLANKPGLTIKEISRLLSCSEKIIWDRIDDLESLDKVRKEGSKYRIVGSLIEQWGQKTKDTIFVKNNRFQLLTIFLKTTLAIVFLLLAGVTYYYANPPLHTSSCKFPNGELLIQMPSSLEDGEVGVSKTLVQNTSKNKLSSVNITFTSKNIDYERNGTSLIKLDSIDIGETKSLKLNFISRPIKDEKNYASQVLISHATTKLPNKCYFEISIRVIPIKKSWGLISLLLVTISGFFAKPDLPQLITNLVSGLFKPQGENKSEGKS
ncbi:hypothetical protein WA1_50565 [Scytonema hofmannii PCC 7110]|uniref:Uncharacterized protein n=1 Tax=Scytonema hofmannii PCC 7110 TaxID=128403 RepID=A0A139WQF8_9CYAN|nr:AsnC family protein [Scytonema hofmannii]KYC34662.1 hypothetical protein WA1_50565 [Scytonema hofmannii PCC 7110]